VDLADRTQPAIPVEIQQVMSAILLGSISMRPHNGSKRKKTLENDGGFPPRMTDRVYRRAFIRENTGAMISES
jgi:hypothetical protein